MLIQFSITIMFYPYVWLFFSYLLLQSTYIGYNLLNRQKLNVEDSKNFNKCESDIWRNIKTWITYKQIPTFSEAGYRMSSMPDIKITLVTGPSEMGEGPFWYDKTQTFYYIDMWKQLICRYTPFKNETACGKVPGDKPVTFVMPIEDPKANNKFIIGYGNGVATLTWDGESKDVSKFRVVDTIDHSENNRLNDGKVSVGGILWTGSMGLQNSDGSYPKGVGGLFKYAGCEVTKSLSNMNIPNGMAWTMDQKTMYIADSDDNKIYSYKYNPKTAELSDGCTLVDFKEEGIKGFPDGITIDVEDHIWCATFDGKTVVRIDGKTGKLLRTIKIEAPQVTSVAFGGPDMSTLYVTTAAFQLKEENPKEKSGVYKIENLGIKGAVSVPFYLN